MYIMSFIKINYSISGEMKMVTVKCGESECETEGVENRACWPIPLPKNDNDFPQNKTCLMFVRTAESLPDDCRLGMDQG